MESLTVAEPAAESSSAFLVDLAHFAGPLDLLLALIREEQVDIYDIPIARVASQFLARIGTMALNEAAEYLDMAARLLRIKAQMLLPRPEGDDAWEDPRAELVRRLLEYQQVREVVDVLERFGESRRQRFARTYLPESDQEMPVAPLALSLPELLAAIDRIIRIVRRPVMHEVIPRPLDIDGAMAKVRAVLALRAYARWSDIVHRDAEPWQILSALLALLELAKRGELKVHQSRPFAAVEIVRDVASEAA